MILYHHEPDKTLKEALTAALGIKTVVKKRRRIYFIGNVKFHFDDVDSLGSFVEVEAIDLNGDTSIETLREQCNRYAKLFGIADEDYLAESYSDMLLKNGA